MCTMCRPHCIYVTDVPPPLYLCAWCAVPTVFMCMMSCPHCMRMMCHPLYLGAWFATPTVFMCMMSAATVFMWMMCHPLCIYVHYVPPPLYLCALCATPTVFMCMMCHPNCIYVHDVPSPLFMCVMCCPHSIYVHDVPPPSFGSKYADFSCHVISFACLCSFWDTDHIEADSKSAPSNYMDSEVEQVALMQSADTLSTLSQ